MQKAQIFKYIFLSLAVVLTVLMFMWPTDKDQQLVLKPREVEESVPTVSGDDVSETVDDFVEDTQASTTMVSPRFTGEDDHGRRWEIMADRATQKLLEEGDFIELENVRANAEMSDVNTLSFSSGYGEYSQSQGFMQLSRGVKAEGFGYKLETDGFKVNIKTRDAQSLSKVSIKGKDGSLEAGHFEIFEKGDRIKLSGGVKAQFFASTPLTK